MRFRKLGAVGPQPTAPIAFPPRAGRPNPGSQGPTMSHMQTWCCPNRSCRNLDCKISKTSCDIGRRLSETVHTFQWINSPLILAPAYSIQVPYSSTGPVNVSTNRLLYSSTTHFLCARAWCCIQYRPVFPSLIYIRTKFWWSHIANPHLHHQLKVDPYENQGI